MSEPKEVELIDLYCVLGEIEFDEAGTYGGYELVYMGTYDDCATYINSEQAKLAIDRGIYSGHSVWDEERIEHLLDMVGALDATIH